MTLAGKRVLVTGGAGFIGSHIVDHLVDAGCGDIVAVDNFVRGRPQNLAAAIARGPVRLIEGDIRDHALMEDLVKHSDVIFHQAALRITHCAAEPRTAVEVMVDATFDLLQLCVANDVEKVVMASSASVYGMAEIFPICEREPPYANRTLYGAAKTFGEGLLRSFNDMYGLEYVALRYFNAYGPRMDLHGRYTEVLIRWMERIEAGERPLIFGDGSETMDMIHVADIARANLLAATTLIGDEVLNVASGSEVSLLELARLLARVMGRRELTPEFATRRMINRVARRVGDTTAARQALGFTATISLEEGLRDLVAWWRCERRRAAPAPMALTAQ